MVGRVQVKDSNKSKETADSIAGAEYNYLKTKNQELAKALAQSKSEFTQILAERDYFQRELLCANIQIKKLESYIDVIEDSTKNTFNKIVSCSSDITKSLQTIHFARKITKKLEKDVSDASGLQLSTTENKASRDNSPSLHNHSTNSPTHNSKTHAVKPMVSGHVIFRPVISLRRVNEAEIERSMNIGAQQTTEHTSTNLVTEEEVTQDADQQQNTSFRCRSTSYVSSHISTGDLSDENISETGDIQIPSNLNETEEENETDNNRLQTLQEEDEISETLSNSQLATERKNSKDMMIGLFTGVKLFTYNSAQNVSTVNKKKVSVSCNGDSSSQIREDNEETPGRIPLVTTQRGTGERVNYSTFESSPNLSSCSIDNETNLLSRAKCNSSKTYVGSLSEPSTSGLKLRKSQSNVVSQVESSPKNNSTIISGTRSFKSFAANGSIMNGPNVLLENLDASEISKIQQLSILGLEPKHLKNNTSTPFSPVRIKRLVKKVMVEESSSSDATDSSFSTSSASEETTPQRKVSRHNTKSCKNKKQVVLGNPTVILKRLSIPKRKSKSPMKTRDSRTSKRTSSQSSMESNDRAFSENKTRSIKRSIDKTPSGKRTTGSQEKTPKRRKTSVKKKKSEITLLSPQKLSESPIRARRRLPIKSFKEPNLQKKMRRSK